VTRRIDPEGEEGRAQGEAARGGRGREMGRPPVEILRGKKKHNSEEVFLLRLEIFSRFIFMELTDF
jgi:hypothetical protein